MHAVPVDSQSGHVRFELAPLQYWGTVIFPKMVHTCYAIEALISISAAVEIIG